LKQQSNWPVCSAKRCANRRARLRTGIRSVVGVENLSHRRALSAQRSAAFKRLLSRADELGASWPGVVAHRDKTRRLNAASAQAIGLALHELATNAGKYGALSTDKGRIDIDWGTEGETLTMNWTERDGPPVCLPRRRGFGTIVMEQMTERSVGGAVDLDYAPSGLTWRLTCPTANALEPVAPQSMHERSRPRGRSACHGGRVCIGCGPYDPLDRFGSYRATLAPRSDPWGPTRPNRPWRTHVPPPPKRSWALRGDIDHGTHEAPGGEDGNRSLLSFVLQKPPGLAKL
jgi:uncharacterized protein YbjQ (UPF0145 family)